MWGRDMQRLPTKRRLLWGIGIPLLVVFSLYLYWCGGSLPVVAWETEDGAIHLQYKPVKNLAMIWVKPHYIAGTERQWVLVEAGATQRWLLPYAAPEPRLLFKKAVIHEGKSDPVALVRFYEDAGFPGKEYVETAVIRLARGSADVRNRLLEIAERQHLLWLSRCLEE